MPHLGREIECINDMTKSRDPGFTDDQDSRASFLDLFTQLRAADRSVATGA